MSTGARGLSRDAIKYIAIIAMTFNHIAFALLKEGTLLFEIFRDIGSFTAITMCYYLVEGYQRTSSRKAYALRLLVFALLSQIPYYKAFGFQQLNVMFTLLICFGILYVREHEQDPTLKPLKIALLASRASLLELGDAPAWILTGFIVLAIHAALMLVLCRLLKLDLFTAGVASLANIGGTASAPVLAGSYAGSLVPVGILMALMGYVVGTPLATLCANIMKLLA